MILHKDQLVLTNIPEEKEFHNQVALVHSLVFEQDKYMGIDVRPVMGGQVFAVSENEISLWFQTIVT